MLLSMTGYGKNSFTVNKKKYTVEIKSLNSKQLEINTRIPNNLRDGEMEIRNLISQQLHRGKVDLYIEAETFEETDIPTINMLAAKNYYRQLTLLTEELNIKKDSDILAVIMRLPDVLKKEKDIIKEDEWAQIITGIKIAINQLQEFRKNEGENLAKDIRQKVSILQDLLSKIDLFEKQRIENIRTRINKHLNDLTISNGYDKDRFEQEMIFYIEKLDITEEKVRLASHYDYFLQTLEKETEPGKKLGFIAQEITREINTIGAKANDINIQNLVIQMKDETEKIKEQLNNIL